MTGQSRVQVTKGEKKERGRTRRPRWRRTCSCPRSTGDKESTRVSASFPCRNDSPNASLLDARLAEGSSPPRTNASMHGLALPVEKTKSRTYDSLDESGPLSANTGTYERSRGAQVSRIGRAGLDLVSFGLLLQVEYEP